MRKFLAFSKTKLLRGTYSYIDFKHLGDFGANKKNVLVCKLCVYLCAK